MDEQRYGRRVFLTTVAGGLSSLFWAGPAWRAISDVLSPAGGVLPEQLRSLVPTDGWRIFSIGGGVPHFDPKRWRLTIDGLVERPQSLSYSDVLSLPRAEQVSSFHCVSGWSVSRVRWAGVRFEQLLAKARPLPEAKALRFMSAEVPYEDYLTLEQAHRDDAMLAYGMDGRRLSGPHGRPVRVVLPAMYGYKNVKWVKRIELVPTLEDGYWEQRGYDRNAWVGRSNGR